MVPGGSAFLVRHFPCINIIVISIPEVLDSLQQRLDATERPQHQQYYSALFDKCVGTFKSPYRRLRDWTYGLHMLEQRQHHLNYFKTLIVGLARI